MENVYENVGSGRRGLQQLTPKTVKEILEKMYNSCTNGDPHARIQEARTIANNDAVEIMRLVFPIVIETKIQVLDDLNLQFEKGADGLKEFLKFANHYSHEDQSVREIFMKLRDLYLPRFQRPNSSSWTFSS